MRKWDKYYVNTKTELDINMKNWLSLSTLLAKLTSDNYHDSVELNFEWVKSVGIERKKKDGIERLQESRNKPN